MSTSARGLIAVTTDTRLAAAATLRRASSSSGPKSSRSARRVRSAPSMVSSLWLAHARRAPAGRGSGRPPRAPLERDQVADDRAGFVAIVGLEGGLGPHLQLLDVSQP